jgi:ABC-type Zn2+ transport system substrate-binding protein/surface adhesin
MDKSFNDKELSDIMKEIEALEEDFKTQENEFTVAASPVIEELAHMSVEDSVPVAKVVPHIVPQQEKHVEHHHNHGPAQHHHAHDHDHDHEHDHDHHHHHAPAGHSAMSFKVSGDIKLDLQFDVGGKIVELCVNESGLHIKMEGGMTFTVPLTHEKKKVA